MPSRVSASPTKLLIFLIYGIQMIFEFNTEESKALILCPLKKDKQHDRIEVLSFQPFAQAKPLEVETCNGPEKEISP